MRGIPIHLAAMLALSLACGPALAADDDDLALIRQQLDQQASDIAAQRKELDRQQQLIEQLRRKLAEHQAAPSQPAVASVSPASPVQAQPATGTSNNAAPPVQVGEAPEDKDHPPEIQTIASVGGVLTRPGVLVLEPYAEYVHTSLNQFTFEGVQIIDALLIGVINAGRTEQDLGLLGGALRYGLTDGLELEARFPYVYRAQQDTGVLLNSSNTVVSSSAHGSGLGDIEAALHYQFNDGSGSWPFVIGNLRFKSDSGSSPWDVAYNSNGSPRTLPTGSGFSALNPSVTAIFASDPAVLYANAGWIHNFQDGATLTLNNTAITDINPGDTYSASFGMGMALNDTVSFSLGYEQDYIEATTERVNGGRQKAPSLLAGELALGFTLRTSERNSINLGLNVGVTRDAPDVELVLRTPFAFDTGARL
ncbi:MAG TPA: autotransporter outer membrane beta-barrel domain-containing protein [Rhizomicrobium sp.]|nr:autotransporter outer membrane beta-barrel domain-containing protein [Rhizomicrobium sp.]